MAHEVTLHDFSELAQFFPEGAAIAPGLPAREVQPEVELGGAPAGLGQILLELERASATLATIARRDEEAKAQALSDLERYDALVETAGQAQAALAQAQQLLTRAREVTDNAFADEAREAAEHVVELAERSEKQTAALAAQAQAEVDAFGDRADVQRLLRLRQQMEDQERAKAAESERAGRLSSALSRAGLALKAGRFEEARTLVESVVDENPDNAEIASLLDSIARAELAVKAETVEEVLWQARRAYKHETAGALALLEGLDVDGLPEGLAGQVFGQWAKTAARVCRERGLSQPLRYAPRKGRGAVLTRHPSGAYEVVSAFGLGGRWQPGSLVGEHFGQAARPLT